MKEIVIAIGSSIITLLLMAIPVMAVLGIMNICVIPVITTASCICAILEFIGVTGVIFSFVHREGAQ